jgi:DNA (cytosine-5)-methyltransferase 1
MGSELKAIDLFCGCGGMSLGAARAGFSVSLGVDKDLRALASHIRNFPKSKHSSCDLSMTAGKSLLAKVGLRQGEVDLVIGGPPCQGFSPIGKRDISDHRNQLIGDFFRLVAEIRPAAFVVENVPGILSPIYEGILLNAKALLEDEYSIFSPHEMSAIEAGAPTVRTRVVIVGFRKRIAPDPACFWRTDPVVVARAPVVREALDGLPVDICPEPRVKGKRVVRTARNGVFFDSVRARVPVGVGAPRALAEYFEKCLVSGCLGTMHSPKLRMRYGSLAYGQMDHTTKSVKLDPNGYCPTLRAGTGPERGSFQAVRPIHYLRPRVITPREAARLQGFPDWFQFDETKWHTFRQLGNSVSPLVAEFVISKVARVLSYA